MAIKRIKLSSCEEPASKQLVLKAQKAVLKAVRSVFVQEVVSLKTQWAPCAASSDLLQDQLLSDLLPCPADKRTMREGNGPSLGGILEVCTQWHRSSLTADTRIGDRHIYRSRHGHQLVSFPQITRQTGPYVMHETEPEAWQQRQLHVLHLTGLHPEKKTQVEREKDTFRFFRVCLKFSSLLSSQNRANPSIWESEQRQQSHIKHFPLTIFPGLVFHLLNIQEQGSKSN